MQLAISVAPATAQPVGTNLTIVASPSGGFGRITYDWTVPAGCTAGNVSEFVCSVAQAGNYTVSVRATDQGGGSNTSSTQFTAYANVVSPPPSVGSATPDLLFYGLGAAAAIVVIGAIAMLRRRSVDPPVPPEPEGPGGTIPGETFESPPTTGEELAPGLEDGAPPPD